MGNNMDEDGDQYLWPMKTDLSPAMDGIADGIDLAPGVMFPPIPIDSTFGDHRVTDPAKVVTEALRMAMTDPHHGLSDSIREARLHSRHRGGWKFRIRFASGTVFWLCVAQTRRICQEIRRMVNSRSRVFYETLIVQPGELLGVAILRVINKLRSILTAVSNIQRIHPGIVIRPDRKILHVRPDFC